MIEEINEEDLNVMSIEEFNVLYNTHYKNLENLSKWLASEEKDR